MIRLRKSPKVGLSASPICSQAESGSGAVAIISEYTGTIARCRPGSSGVYPSVARITKGARTVPPGVTSRPGSMAVTGVFSCSDTPRPRTKRARPRASRAGWIAAQCGVYVPPSTPVAQANERASSAESSRRSSSPNPVAVLGKLGVGQEHPGPPPPQRVYLRQQGDPDQRGEVSGRGRQPGPERGDLAEQPAERAAHPVGSPGKHRRQFRLAQPGGQDALGGVHVTTLCRRRYLRRHVGDRGTVGRKVGTARRPVVPAAARGEVAVLADVVAEAREPVAGSQHPPDIAGLFTGGRLRAGALPGPGFWRNERRARRPAPSFRGLLLDSDQILARQLYGHEIPPGAIPLNAERSTITTYCNAIRRFRHGGLPAECRLLTIDADLNSKRDLQAGWRRASLS